MKTRILIAALAAAGCMSAANAAFVLTFEGAGNNAQLLDFYNGGTDSLGNSGSNYGVSFGSNALSLIDSDSGGTGNFANEPSPNTIMFFLNGSAVLNYVPGFTTGFSFYYSSSTAATVNVYSGLNATGDLIGSLNLSAQGNSNCAGDPNGYFCNWTPVGASFTGTAYSIDFGGTVNQTGFDNITFGSVTPGKIPEPGTLMLAGAALAGLALRRKAA